MSKELIRRIESARRGKNPTVITRMRSGWAVLGDWQFLKGYSLLLADPIAESINSLPKKRCIQFFCDMTSLGDALLKVTGARRINYEILGNHDNYLHAHLFPRFETEDVRFMDKPVYLYPVHLLNSSPFDLVLHGKLIGEIRRELTEWITSS